MLQVAVSLSVIVVVTIVVLAATTSLPVLEPGLAIETWKSSLPSTKTSPTASTSIHRSPIGLPSLVKVSVVPSKANIPGPV